MGGGGSQPSTTTVVQSSQSQSNPPTEQELALQKLELERRQASQGNMLQLDQNLFNLLSPLSLGQAPGGMFSGLGQGISPEVQADIVNRSIALSTPSFEKAGLLDSGVRMDLQNRRAAEILTQHELARQSQIESMFGALFGANVQANAPILSSSEIVANSLANARGFTSSGTSTTTQNIGGRNRGLFSFF